MNIYDTLAEWLRRQPAKLLGSARAGSNPTSVIRYFGETRGTQSKCVRLPAKLFPTA